jgi:hypothetical protein
MTEIILAKTKIGPRIEVSSSADFYSGAFDYPAGFHYRTYIFYIIPPHNDIKFFLWGFSKGLMPDQKMIYHALRAHARLCKVLRARCKIMPNH